MALMDALPIVFPDPEPNELRSYVIPVTYADSAFTNKLKKLNKAIEDICHDQCHVGEGAARVRGIHDDGRRTLGFPEVAQLRDLRPGQPLAPVQQHDKGPRHVGVLPTRPLCQARNRRGLAVPAERSILAIEQATREAYVKGATCPRSSTI